MANSYQKMSETEFQCCSLNMNWTVVNSRDVQEKQATVLIPVDGISQVLNLWWCR